MKMDRRRVSWHSKSADYPNYHQGFLIKFHYCLDQKFFTYIIEQNNELIAISSKNYNVTLNDLED